MTVNSKAEAWIKADEIFPTDYSKDELRSSRAGFDVYYSTVPGVVAWINDLGDRLEVNLENGKTVNIWIKPSSQFTEYQIADALRVIDEAIYQIDDNVMPALADAAGISEARKTLYSAYAKIAKIIDRDCPGSRLKNEYNLDEA